MNFSTMATVASDRGGLVPIASDKYVRELDGIRAVAIGFVVCAHYRLLPLVPGGFGVTLFFFLSGYLITTLFFSEYHLSNGIDIFRFYLRRWIRLTPPLLIMILVAVVFYRITRVFVDGTPVPTGTIMAALLYYTNYYDLAWGMSDNKVIPFGPCWSLAVEEHFYLLWPLIIKFNINNPRKLLSIIVLACLTILLWRAVAHWGLSVSTDYTGIATDTRIDSILYGALLRVLFETPWKIAVVNILRMRVIRIIGICIIMAAFVIRNDGFRETVRYSLQGIALMPLFTAILTDRPDTLVRRILASPAMVLVGRLSYSIYLFHLISRTPAEVIFGSPYRIESVVSGLLITMSASYLMLVFVERPLGRLRHRLRREQGAPSPILVE
jgi:peptidoglycan/LPS O-acetylase OafA/YrhL